MGLFSVSRSVRMGSWGEGGLDVVFWAFCSVWWRKVMGKSLMVRGSGIKNKGLNGEVCPLDWESERTPKSFFNLFPILKG
jgi:hypothetical protein